MFERLLEKKKAALLVENIIFIILNFIFITIMVLFIASRAGGVMLLEESYAKNIALLVDGARPGMEIYLDLERAIEKAENEKWPVDEMININENIITVKLSKDSGYSYSFFNDVSVEQRFDVVDKKGFYFTIGDKT